MLTLFLLNLSLTWAAAPQPPRGMDYKIDANGAYFYSTSNYKAGGGSTTDLPNGGYFQDLVTTVTYTQDMDDQRRFYGGFNYAATESDDGTNTRTNGGFNEILGGGQYWLRAMGYDWGPSIDVVYPLSRVNRGGDDVLLGEGAMKVKLGTWAMWTTGSWTPFAFAGYEYRDEGRSHAIPYSLGVKWQNSPIYVQAEYRGFERLFSNADSENRTSRDVYLRKVDGGSYRYYSINPSGSEFAIEAGFQIGPVMIYGGGAITVNGSSSAQGWTALIGASYSPAGRIPGHVPDEFDRINKPDDERFTPQMETFDEFDPTKPPPSGEMARPKAKPRPSTPKVAPLPPAPPPPPADYVPPAPPAPKAQPTQPPPETDLNQDGIDSGDGGGVKVQLRPAPKKPTPKPAPAPSAPKAKPAPAKPVAKPRPPVKAKPKAPAKTKVDQMLENTEKNLKDL